MDPALVAFFAVGSVVSAIALGVQAIVNARRRRHYDARTPVSTIASAKPGAFVRLIGTIVEGDTVEAPITGRSCACFSALATTLVLEIRHDRYGREYEGLREQGKRPRVGSAAFVVDDGTGRIAVQPAGLMIIAHPDFHEVVEGRPAIHDDSMLPYVTAFDEVVLDEGIITVGTRVVLEGVVQRGVAAPDVNVFRTGKSTAILTPASDRSTSVSNVPDNLQKAERFIELAQRTK